MTDFARVEIRTANAAFTDETAPESDREAHAIARDTEIARLLREAADRIEQGEFDGNLIDVNGSTVGYFNAQAKAMLGRSPR